MSGITEHFRALTPMTPIQFQKQIRLHEARTRLLAEPGDIAGAGFACSTGMTLPTAGMSLPRHRICVRARLFRFLLAPMRGTADAGTLFTWRGSVS
jgi:AraC-like DNA-binding protein